MYINLFKSLNFVDVLRRKGVNTQKDGNALLFGMTRFAIEYSLRWCVNKGGVAYMTYGQTASVYRSATIPQFPSPLSWGQDQPIHGTGSPPFHRFNVCNPRQKPSWESTLTPKVQTSHPKSQSDKQIHSLFVKAALSHFGFVK